jgi:selenide,water dikinase
MKQIDQPIRKDLVLLGGGHSHAIALRMFGMKPLSGVRVTLLTEASDTAYSGMLPGHVAGFYSREQCHIDLRRLAQFAGAQLYLDRAIGLDLQTNQILCATRPPVRFDWLSIDIGSTPKPLDLPNPTIIAAKPVRHFLQEWDRVVQRVTQSPDQPISLGIVGGGAGGVELALTIQHRLQQILRAANQPQTHLTIHLFHRAAELMLQHGRWVRDRLHQVLIQRDIQLHLPESVQTVNAGQVQCESGLTVNCDEVFWVTHASAPDWLGKSGLAVDQEGFVLVDDTLRSCSHAQVFAAGDVATMVNHPRPKAGVFAVRQAKPLVENLRRSLQAKSLKPFQPQHHYLGLIGTADGSAIASWGTIGWQASWLWRWKDHIDRRFMQQFTDLPKMDDRLSNSPAPKTTPSPMLCAGCGAKVGSSVLDRVLQRLPTSRHLPSSLIGLDTPDDAAVLQIPAEKVLVQTIDYFPTLINDPFVFGQISATHALSDLFAMGAQPHSALALATIPHADSANAEETLYQLLSGALRVLHEAKAALMGGHTIASVDLAFGLSCNGLAHADRLLRKSGMQPGQGLILTKPIGTGTLFAANMQLQAKGEWIDGAIAAMLQSNQAAATCFLQHHATACTDITGFGLAGHLLEMVRASHVAVKLDLAAIPVLAGALETAKLEILSSLHPQNFHAAQSIANLSEVRDRPKFPLLFDPQTSGGLLAAVPASDCDRCLADLKGLGYTEAAIVGHTLSHNPNQKPITIS